MSQKDVRNSLLSCTLFPLYFQFIDSLLRKYRYSCIYTLKLLVLCNLQDSTTKQSKCCNTISKPIRVLLNVTKLLELCFRRCLNLRGKLAYNNHILLNLTVITIINGFICMSHMQLLKFIKII